MGFVINENASRGGVFWILFVIAMGVAAVSWFWSIVFIFNDLSSDFHYFICLTIGGGVSASRLFFSKSYLRDGVIMFVTGLIAIWYIDRNDLLFSDQSQTLVGIYAAFSIGTALCSILAAVLFFLGLISNVNSDEYEKGNSKICGECAEEIKSAARKCRYCGSLQV